VPWIETRTIEIGTRAKRSTIDHRFRRASCARPPRDSLGYDVSWVAGEDAMRHDSALALQAEILERDFRFRPTDEWLGEADAGIAALTAEVAPASRFMKAPSASKSRQDDIALGLRRTSGRADADDFELVVFGQSRSALQDPLVERIRRRARGEAAIEYIGRIKPQAWHMGRARPLRLGASVSDLHPPARPIAHAGTLGFFARDSVSGHEGFVSNNHVIAGSNRTPVGTPVVQPGVLDGGVAADRIATLTRFVPMLFGGAPNVVDAAFAQFDEPTPAIPARDLYDTGDALVLNAAGTASVVIGDHVVKVGRSTGVTYGEVVAVSVMNLNVAYGSRRARFDNQIQIESRNINAFSRPGDSGSLIVNSKGAAIGLLFAGGATGGTHGSGYTFANPIDAVLKLLDVTLI
jgi:hypothetical protein